MKYNKFDEVYILGY